jgi:hypothetical protein
MGSFISIRIPGVIARAQVFPRPDGGIIGRGGGPVELAAPASLPAATISAGPHRVAVYMTSDTTVPPITVTTNTVPRSISVGFGPAGVSITPDDTTASVTNSVTR